ARRGVPAMWWVGPNGAPAGLSTRLESRGLSLARTMVGVAVGVEALDPGAGSAVPGLRIEPAGDAEARRLWARLLGEGSGFGAAAARTLAEVEPVLDDPDYLTKTRYVGLLDGRPVSTAALVPAAGLAGVYAVSTLPDARRRGIGAAMTAFALLEARARGYRVGVLQATAMALPVYRRLGF